MAATEDTRQAEEDGCGNPPWSTCCHHAHTAQLLPFRCAVPWHSSMASSSCAAPHNSPSCRPACLLPPCRQIVLRKLCLALMPKLDDELRHSTAQDAAFYEHRLQVCG